MTTETTEQRVSRLEGAYDQLDKRLTDHRQETENQFGELKEEILGLRIEIHDLRVEVNERSDRVTSFIMIGGIIAVVGAVTASIVVNLTTS